MTNLHRRLKKLEARNAPPQPPRLVVRYEGCDWEEPEADIDEGGPNTLVLAVRYVDMLPEAGPTK